MDTSAFSLKEATRLINPHMKDLPFSPLGYHLGLRSWVDFEEAIEDKIVQFRIYSGAVTIPASLLESNLTAVFLVDFKIEGRDQRIDFAKIIVHRRLILERTTSGGEYGHWYLQTTRFRSNRGRGPLHFDSVWSKVVCVDADLDVKISALSDFPDVFWQRIVTWIDESVHSRERTIARIKTFANGCNSGIVNPAFKRKTSVAFKA